MLQTEAVGLDFSDDENENDDEDIEDERTRKDLFSYEDQEDVVIASRRLRSFLVRRHLF